jgi:hypothetical protein
MWEWVHGPSGPDAVKGQAVRSGRTVLVEHGPVPAPPGRAGCRELRQRGDAP